MTNWSVRYKVCVSVRKVNRIQRCAHQLGYDLVPEVVEALHSNELTDWLVIMISRHRNTPYFAAIAVLLISTVLSSCATQAQQGQAQTPPPPIVEIATVALQEAAIYTEYPAQTYARNLVEVRGRVDGYIEKWLFTPGQMVRAGQPLYTLDQRPYRAQVEQAQGSVRQAEAELIFAKQQVSLIEAQARLEAAKSSLTKAQQDYNRLKPLVEQDAAARQDLDAAIAALRSAESDVAANDAAVRQAQLSTSTQIQSTEGRVQQQRGTLTAANLNLQYGTIRSPITGMVGDTLVPVGGLVSANAAQPLTTIAPLDPMWVRFKLSEAQFMEYQRLHKNPKAAGPPLELFLADGTRFPHTGKIENSLNQVDPRTGTVELQAKFPNPQNVLLPGQFGRLRFQMRVRQEVVVIPQRAVQQNLNVQTVFTVGAGDKVEARPVTTGERVGNDWIIEQGLRPGDRVIVEGVMSVRPGVVVRPTPYRNETGAAAPAKAE